MTTARTGFLRAIGAVAASMASMAVLAALPAAASASTAPPRRVMILLDTNNSIPAAGITAERTAALAYARALPAGVQAGLITFSSRWQLVLRPTTNRGKLAAALPAAASAAGSSAGISGALAAAVSQVRGTGTAAQGRLLVLSDAEELSGALTAGIPADVVTWRYDGDDHLKWLRQLASATGGRAVPPARAGALASAFATPAAAPPSTRAQAPAPAPSTAGGLSSTLVLLLAGVFVALLVLVLVLFGSLRQIDRSRQLKQRLERYGSRHAAVPAQQAEGAVARTVLTWGTRVLQSSSAEPRLALRLDLAGINRRPAEWAMLGVSLSALFALAFTLLLGNALIGVLAGIAVGWLGMRLVLSFRISRRRAAFSEQLPDVLQLIAGSLQAGFSLPQALDAIVREGTQPTAVEFSRALAETRIGIDLGVALDEVATRMNSRDLRWTVMAIQIQRQVGGNLTEILQNTIGTMRERAYLRRHVRALSAEGRLSAYILVALPLLLAAWLFYSDGQYMRPLYTTLFGLIMIIGGSVLMVLGSLWLRNLVKMEV